MSENLLTTRLRTFAAHGLVVEVPGLHGHEKRYRLTDAGRDLGSVVDQLGRWGQRRLAPLPLGELDTGVLLRDICAQMTDRLPDRPLTVEVAVADAPSARRWWLALSPAGASVHEDMPRNGPTCVCCAHSAGWRACGWADKAGCERPGSRP